MSRSRRHSPCAGMCGGSRASEKQFKRLTHATMRAAEKRLLRAALHDEDPCTAEVKMPRKPRDVVEPWSGEKDGKHWFGNNRNPEKGKWMRK